jgi:predicted kinase
MNKNYKKVNKKFIEKVLRKKKINDAEHALVKWMGYSDKFNEWIPIQNLHKPLRNRKCLDK